jgi:hypothetical protein
MALYGWKCAGRLTLRIPVVIATLGEISRIRVYQEHHHFNNSGSSTKKSTPVFLKNR